MAENPYEPPTADKDDFVEPIEPPTYLGSLNHISGDIEKEEALRIASECGEVEVDSKTVTQTAKSGGGSWRTSLLLFGVVFAFVFFVNFGDDDQTNPSAQPSPEWVGTAMIIGWVLPIAWVGLIVFMMIRYRMKPEDSDPPFWGHCEIVLAKDWYCVSKETNDSIRMKIFCRWKDTYVKESESAWYLMALDYCVTLIPKGWVDQVVDRQVLNGFIYEVARYQHTKIHSTAEKNDDEEVDVDDWLGEPDANTRFRLDFTAKRSNRDSKRLLKTIRRRYPDWSLQWQWPLSPAFWKYAGLIVCIVSCVLAVAAAWQNAGGSRWTGISILAPLIIVSFLSYLLGRLMKWDGGDSGWITRDRLRVDQKSSKIELDLESYSTHEVLSDHQAIVFASESGKSVTWVRRESFETDTDWERACELLGVV